MLLRSLMGMGAHTAAEKRAALNGISLFFGALIGANLGALEALALRDYALLIAIVCLLVLYIHLAPVARARWTNLGLLGVMLAGLYLLLMHDMGAAAFHGPRPTPHLFVTLCFWMASLVAVEMKPVFGADGRRNA